MSLKTEKPGKQKLYILCDTYLRFYIKYIEPNLSKITKNAFENTSLSTLPNWQTIMGLQLESLLLQNRSTLLRAMRINSADIVIDNPYSQKATKSYRGCQIDYLVQTNMRNLYICEFKFNKRTLGLDIITEVQNKIDALKIPKYHGVVTVLFHLGEVSASVYESNYFYKIIDINDFFEFG